MFSFNHVFTNQDEAMEALRKWRICSESQKNQFVSMRLEWKRDVTGAFCTFHKRMRQCAIRYEPPSVLTNISYQL